jgi:hypothetical protein
MSLKNQTSQRFSPRLEFLQTNIAGIELRRGATALGCPYIVSEVGFCGDWCPHFDLQEHTFGQESNLILTLHCSGRRLMLNEKGEVIASRNLKGS